MPIIEEGDNGGVIRWVVRWRDDAFLVVKSWEQRMEEEEEDDDEIDAILGVSFSGGVVLVEFHVCFFG